MGRNPVTVARHPVAVNERVKGINRESRFSVSGTLAFP
jgi:hypothetical protein